MSIGEWLSLRGLRGVLTVLVLLQRVVEVPINCKTTSFVGYVYLVLFF